LIVSGLPLTALLRYRRRSSPGFPGNCIFRCQLMNVRVAPSRSPAGFARENPRVTPTLLWSLAPPIDLAPVRPGPLVLRWCSRVAFRYAPDCSSSAVPLPLPQVAPKSLPRWVDDESWLSSNFASPACAADESSSPYRLAFRARPATLSQSLSTIRYRQSQPRTIELDQSRIACRTRTAVQIPTGSPTDYRQCSLSICGSKCKSRVNLWISPGLVQCPRLSRADARIAAIWRAAWL